MSGRNTTGNGVSIPRIAGRAALFAGLWWIVAEGRTDGWLLGGIAVLAATWASLALSPPRPEPLRAFALAGFAAFFVVNSVRGGFQVALMALRGRASLRPATLELPLILPAGAPQVLLSNVLSLMPGSVSVGLAGNNLRLHVLDDRLPVATETKALEQRIARLFGLAT